MFSKKILTDLIQFANGIDIPVRILSYMDGGKNPSDMNRDNMLHVRERYNIQINLSGER